MRVFVSSLDNALEEWPGQAAIPAPYSIADEQIQDV